MQVRGEGERARSLKVKGEEIYEELSLQPSYYVSARILMRT